jgi:hypothetical protein
MLQRLNRLRGGPVHALDGDIGAIRDFYFDDERWTVRYLVVETGRWLRGRLLLVPLCALREPQWTERRVPVRLTREQVAQSPDVNAAPPVSRAMEAAALRHYGYPYYWTGPALWGPVASPALAAALPPAPPRRDDTEPGEDRHLRSCREVTGYHLRARDGDIGHADDFVVDGLTWRIDHIVVDTSNWIGGRAVAISPDIIETISWSERLIYVAATRAAVASAPPPLRQD